MRLWYLTQLTHPLIAQLYKINHRLYKLYLNTINYILPSITSVTVLHYCKTGVINAYFLHEYLRVIMRPLASLQYIAHTAHSKALVHLDSASLSHTLSHPQRLHLPKYSVFLDRVDPDLGRRWQDTCTYGRPTVSTTRAPVQSELTSFWHIVHRHSDHQFEFCVNWISMRVPRDALSLYRCIINQANLFHVF